MERTESEPVPASEPVPLACWKSTLGTVDIFVRPAHKASEGILDEATAVLDHAAALIALDRHREALAPASRAVELRRALAAADSGQRHVLAEALMTLAAAQIECAPVEDALRSLFELVVLRRGLAGLRAEGRAELACALGLFGCALAAAGRSQEALDIGLEVVDLSRGQADPVRRAAALSNVANRLFENGRIGEAIRFASSAAAIYGELGERYAEMAKLCAGNLEAYRSVIGTWASYGRVDDGGTVWVKTLAGERPVGSWRAGTPEEGLAHFVGRYESLLTEVAVLEIRLESGADDPCETLSAAARLRAGLSKARIVGDIDGLALRLDMLIAETQGA